MNQISISGSPSLSHKSTVPDSYSEHKLIELLALHEGIISEHQEAAAQLRSLLEDRSKTSA